jgi:hypothetical protein
MWVRFKKYILELKAMVRAGIAIDHFIAFTKETLNEKPEGSATSGTVLSENSMDSSPAESTPNRKLEGAAREHVKRCKPA